MSTPCVLVKGSDPALVAQAAHDVIGSLLADLDPSTCVEELGGPSVDDFDLGRLVDALTTPPFLVDRRIVVVREAGRLTTIGGAALLSTSTAGKPVAPHGFFGAAEI